MKRTTKIITITILSFGLVSGGAFAYAKHKFDDPSKRADFVVSKITKKLDLDDSQKLALVELKDQLLISKQKVKAESKPIFEEVAALVEADTFDQSAALDMVTTKTAAINESAPALVAALGNFLDGLSPEQKAEVLEIMERKKKHRHHDHD